MSCTILKVTKRKRESSPVLLLNEMFIYCYLIVEYSLSFTDIAD